MTKRKRINTIGFVVMLVVICILGVIIHDGFVPGNANGSDKVLTASGVHVETSLYGPDKFMDNLASHEPFYQVANQLSEHANTIPKRKIPTHSGKYKFVEVSWRKYDKVMHAEQRKARMIKRSEQDRDTHRNNIYESKKSMPNYNNPKPVDSNN